MNGVRALRQMFPDTPIVADLKTMDGGYLEAEMMAKAGATHVVVMAQGTRGNDSLRRQSGSRFRRAGHGRQYGLPRHGHRAKWLEDLGCDFVIHHIGYDERRGIAARGLRGPARWTNCDRSSRPLASRSKPSAD